MRLLRAALALSLAATSLVAQQRPTASADQSELLGTLPGTLRTASPSIGAFPMASNVAGRVNVRLGDVRVLRVAPGQSVELPLIVDPSTAGGSNVASLTTTVTWDASRLMLDSVRAGSFGTLTANTANAASGQASLSILSPTGSTSAVQMARLFFTAAGQAGGTTIVLAPSAMGTQQGVSLLGTSFVRQAQACVAAPGNWGDVNGDGQVNIIDAQQIARASVQLSVARPELVGSQGDVNADELVDILDAQQIARASVGLDAAARIGTPAFTLPAIASVVVTPAAPTLEVGTPRMFTASPRTSGGAAFDGCADVTWTSSAPSVATVDSTGIVVGLIDGDLTLTAAAAGAEGSTPVTVGAGAGTGIRVTFTSPEGASRYYAYVQGGALSTPLLQPFNLGFARSGVLDLEVPAGTGYRVRLFAADSLALAPETAPVIAAGVSLSDITVVDGARTSVNAALQPITLEGIVPATIAAGEPFTVDATLTDPTGLWYDLATFVNVYRGYSAFTADRQFGATNAFGVTTLNATQKRFLSEPFRATQVGTIYSQYGSGVSFTGGVTFWLYSRSIQRGEQPAETQVTAATTGLRVNITSPVAVSRFIVAVDTGSGAPAWGGITGAGMTNAQVEVPISAGSNYRVRVAGVDDFGFSAVTFATGGTLRAGGLLGGQTVTAGSFGDVNITLATSAAAPGVPATGSSGVATPFNGTMRDPSDFSRNNACLLRYSTTGPIQGASLGTLVSNACTAGPRDGSGTYTVAGNIPAVTGPDTVYSMVFTSTIVFNAAGERLEIVHSGFGTTDIQTPVTTGVRLNITSPVGASRYLAFVTGGGLPNAVFRFTTGFARQQTVTIPLPAATGATIRVVAADSLATAPDSVPLVAAGYRLTNVNVVNGQITELAAPLAPVTVTYEIAETASVGAPLTAVVTIDDPSYILAPSATWANVFLSNAPPSEDRSGSGVQLTDVEILSETSKRFSGTVLSPLDEGTVYTQAGFGVGTGQGAVFWALAPSLQRGEAVRATAITTPPNLATLTVNATANSPHNIYAVIADQGPSTPAVLRVLAGPSTSTRELTLPIATAGTYRVRVAALDSALVVSPTRLSAELKEGNYVEGVVIAEGASVTLNISLVNASSAVTVPTTAFTGAPIQYGGLARDPARFNEGEICIARWTDTGTLYGSGGFGIIAQGCFTANRTADGTRNVNGALPNRATPGTRSSQVIMSRAYLLPNGHVLESNQFSPITETLISAAPTTGIRVAITSPVGPSRYYAWVTGGALPNGQLTRLQTNFARNATMLVPVPAGSGYRVRILAADSLSASPDVAPLLAAGSNTTDVTVTEGALTDIATTLEVPTVDAPMPTTGTEGSAIPLSVTLVDPSATMGEIATWAIRYSSYAPFTADRAVGSQLVDETVEVLSPISRRFTDSFIPVQSGTLYTQFGFGITLGGSTTFWIIAPSLQRGEPLAQTTVAAAANGVNVQVTSNTAVNRFLVVADNGPGTATVVKDVTGTAMTDATVQLPIAASANVRVRVAALNDIAPLSATRMLSSLRGGGVVTGVSVTNGAFTDVPVTLTANSNTISVTPTTTVGNALMVSGTFTDPSLITTEALPCAVRFSDTGPIGPSALGTLAFTCTASNAQPDGTFSINGTIAGRADAGTRWWLVLTNPGFLNQNGLTIEIDQTVGGSSTFTAP